MFRQDIKNDICRIFNLNRYPGADDPIHHHEITYKTIKQWHLRKYYCNTPDVFIRMLEREYEKPRSLSMPGISLFISGDKGLYEASAQSASGIPCTPSEIVDICGLSASEADEKIKNTKSEYLAFLRSGCLLNSRAFYECVKVIKKESPGLIYSDNAKKEDDGSLVNPEFKPDYAPDLLMSVDYYGGFVMISRKAYENAGGFEKCDDGDHLYDLWLRISEKEKVSHIDRILFYETAKYSKPGADASVIKKALARRNLKGTVTVKDNKCIIDHETEGLVSIIIPSKDHPENLKKCLESLDKETLYKDYEIIVVDNGSSEENKKHYLTLCEKYNTKYVYEVKEFNFSFMCNLGASHARGDVLVFLNDDIVISDGRWLGSMAGQARLPYAGAVGCLLIYPDSDMIQHGGTIDCEDGPNHILQGSHLSEEICRDVVCPSDINAVTAACLAVRKDRFDKIGGYDERLTVCYNDVALCFDLINAGFVNCMRGDICLIHCESASRGHDALNEEKYRRLLNENEILYKYHSLKDSPHPFYNINMTRIHSDRSPRYEKWLYDCKTKIRKMTAREIEKWKSAPQRSNYKYCFDSCDSFRYIHIFGWSYDKDHNENYSLKRKLVMYNEKDYYIADLGDWYRPDIYMLNDMKDTEYCGFRAKAERSDLPEGNYKLSIWTKLGRCDTDTELIR